MKTISELINLEGRKAVITGATGGLGRHMASTIVELGGDIIMVDMPGSDYSSLTSDLRKINNVDIQHIDCNLEDKDERSNLITNIIKDHNKGIDILINNAAFGGTSNLSGWATKFEDQSVDTWRRAIEVNLTAVFDLSQGLSDLLRKTGNGSIINISSILGLRVGVQQTSYAVSKAGLTQLTKMMALELARNNIRVNAIAPGYIQSEMTEDFFNTTEGKNYMKKIPQRRYGNPEDLDGAILLLASEASSFMTGSVIPVDGGHLINPM